jgi:CubicO group peptidase (beta-lactamase class C family)
MIDVRTPFDETDLASLEARIRAFLLRVRSETGVPAIGVALRLGGRRVAITVGARAAGDAARLATDARFHLGCATKLLLAAVTLELARSGALELGAAIGEYLPELARTRHGESVWVSHLLSHTSGYRGTNIFERSVRDLGWEGLVDYLRSAPQLFRPGSVFNYEHTESVLLGRILERVTGRASLTLIRERILDPLGIVPGRLADSEDDPLCAGRNDYDARARRFVALPRVAELPELWHAAFSSYTVSLGDLLRIAEALIGRPDARAAARGTHDSQVPASVSEETRRRLLRPVVRLPASVAGSAHELLPVAFGLGAATLPGGLHGNNGLSQGQCLALRFDPATHVVAVAGLNATLPRLRDLVLASVLAEATGRSTDAPKPRRADVGLHELPGRYVGPGSAVLGAALVEDRLILEIGAERAAPTFIGELVAGAEGALVLHAVIPQLALGVFREPDSGSPAFMLGLNAYKRVMA